MASIIYDLILIFALVCSKIDSTDSHLKRKSHLKSKNSIAKNIFTQMQTATTTNTLQAPTPTPISAICYINNQGTVFNIFPAYNANADYIMPTADGNQISMNFCAKPRASCKNSGSLINYNTNTSCSSLTGPSYFSSYRVYFNPVLNKTLLTQAFPPGDACNATPTQQYQMSINYFCTSDPLSIVINTTTFNIASCVNSIDVTANFACPQYNVYGLWNSFNTNQAIVSFCFILLGLYFLILAKRFSKFTIYLSGVVLVIFVTLFIILNSLSYQILNWQLCFALGFSIFTGFLIGFLIKKVKWAVFSILGGIAGYAVGIIAYHFVGINIGGNSMIVYFLVILVFSAAGSIWGYYNSFWFILISFSTVGSFCLIKGISIFIGNYPDERQIMDLKFYGETFQLAAMTTYVYYIYVLFTIVIAGLGAYLQYKYFCSEQEKSSRKIEWEEEKPLNDEESPEPERY